MDRAKSTSNALAIAARSASTSYKEELPPEVLATILRSGIVPDQYCPHLITLLDEVPSIILTRAVAEAATPEAPVDQINAHLICWAKQWHIVWNA